MAFLAHEYRNAPSGSDPGPGLPGHEDACGEGAWPEEPGALYARLFEEYLQARAAFEERVRAIGAREAAELAAWSALRPVFAATLDEDGQSDALRVAERIAGQFRALVLERVPAASRRAIGAAMAGQVLVESVESVVFDGVRRRDLKACDLRALWRRLGAAYGGERGREMGYREAARGIEEILDLRPGAAVERRGGAVVLALRVAVDAFERKYGEAARLGLWSREAIEKLTRHLQTFAAWAEDDSGLGEALEVLPARYGWGSDAQVRSRERVRLGSALSVVTYQQRFELEMDAALAAKLQVFLGLYGRAAPGCSAGEEV